MSSGEASPLLYLKEMQLLLIINGRIGACCGGVFWCKEVWENGIRKSDGDVCLVLSLSHRSGDGFLEGNARR